jgi:ribosomal protein S18 acetylase RimI-like enzyme
MTSQIEPASQAEPAARTEPEQPRAAVTPHKNTITLREMEVDDYEDAFALWQVTEGIGLSEADSREAIARYLARNPGLSFVARAEDGTLAGAVLCGHDGRRGYLHHLAVRTGCRGQGLGRVLVDHCLAALQAEGIDKCHLFVKRNNPSGLEFWKKIGWSERSLILMSKDVPA